MKYRVQLQSTKKRSLWIGDELATIGEPLDDDDEMIMIIVEGFGKEFHILDQNLP